VYMTNEELLRKYDDLIFLQGHLNLFPKRIPGKKFGNTY